MHEEALLIGIALIAVLGLFAQWLAWRLRIPSVLLLMTFAFLAGPLTGVIDPDHLLGEYLLPFVSLAVGLILFEGGLTLKLREIRATRDAVFRLVTGGAALTWAGIALCARYILGLDWQLALLLGALLSVTGPTVIMPMLRTLRLNSRPASVVKWEGIINDPLMVICGVLVFEAMVAGAASEATATVAIGLLRTGLLGSGLGVAGAAVIYLLLRYHLMPDFLHIALALAVFLAVFVTANHFQTESGLVAVTLMGVLLANQKTVSVKHIIEFKEHLRTLLIAALFIILTARLQMEDLVAAGPASVAFAAALILVVRPAAAWITTAGSSLTRQDRLFLCWMAPRGIVAASVASLFAARLGEHGYVDADRLTSVSIVVVASTVLIYGLTAPILARRLGLAQAHPQGVLFVGAHGWARAIAQALTDAGFAVRMVDTNWRHVARARMGGFQVHYGSVLSDEADENLDLAGIGRVIAMTSNDEANALAAVHCIEAFGRSEVYHLAPTGAEVGLKEAEVPLHLSGRPVFGEDATFDKISAAFSSGFVIKATTLSEEFTYEDFQSHYGPEALPLFIVSDGGKLRVVVAGEKIAPKTGQAIIALVPPQEGQEAGTIKDA
jgi:NhaP-type Na+/H+ or K+/H+ antiporter